MELEAVATARPGRFGQRSGLAPLILLLACALSGCQTAKPVVHQKGLFLGSPAVADLKAEVRSAEALSAPPPAFRRLLFSVRVNATGKTIGEATETLKTASGGYGQYLEEITYRLLSGQCTVFNRSEAVAVGGFLPLLQAGQIWSPDCADWGGGITRREVNALRRVSGQLFPLAVGNRIALQYTLVGSDIGEDNGLAQYQESAEESYDVVERIADFRLDNGRSIGEVFRVRVTASTSVRKKRVYEFLFSTRLNWRVGYTTDIRYILLDWTE